jgi:hypothetical protein
MNRHQYQGSESARAAVFLEGHAVVKSSRQREPSDVHLAKEKEGGKSTKPTVDFFLEHVKRGEDYVYCDACEDQRTLIY